MKEKSSIKHELHDMAIIYRGSKYLYFITTQGQCQTTQTHRVEINLNTKAYYTTHKIENALTFEKQLNL